MKALVVDVENSVTHSQHGNIKKLDLGPYHPGNYLVSAGWCFVQDRVIGSVDYGFFRHNEISDPAVAEDSRARLQKALDEADILVGHNLKHDLSWLLECGFTIDPEKLLFCTSVAEYVLARGLKRDLSLAGSAERRKCPSRKRKDLTQDYLDQGIGFEAIPMPVVKEYGIADVQTTAELFVAQLGLYEEDRNRVLIPTRDMSMEFLWCLTDMERNGVSIDMGALEKIERDYIKEKEELEAYLAKTTAALMGDRPINLASPEQLSMVVFSRRVRDKKQWATTFNIGKDVTGRPLPRKRMSTAQFVSAVKANTDVVYRQKAKQCPECGGTGKVHKTKKDGSLFAKANKCKACDGYGLLYEDTPIVAGLRLVPPPDTYHTAVGGFSTDKEMLSQLADQCDYAGKEGPAKYLRAMVRLNAVDVYLSSFVGGIRRGVINGVLHTKLNQTVTSTGRLSSSDPNFQNQPRGGTFPIRRSIKSRFKGGSIMEADYGQLEFRTAAELSGCANALKAILDGVDVHKDTASILTANGQATSRQEAKSRTFKPLYGGMSGTPAEVAYFETFLTVRYPGVGKWHKALQDEAISTKMITIPSGRQYAFPDAVRTRNGGAKGATKIKNYPVQGFATADIMPCATIRLRRLMRQAGVKSLLILTVHDSLEIDVYPGEEEQMKLLVRDAMLGVNEELWRRYKIRLSVPLKIETKIGPNWLDSKVIDECEQEYKEAA